MLCVFGRDRHAHISYHDYTNSDLKYATNILDPFIPWASLTLDSDGYVGLRTSIAVDGSDHAHISYLDSTNYDLKYATNDSGDWVIQTVDSDGNVRYSTSIAVDGSGYAHISYYDFTNSDLKYATNKPPPTSCVGSITSSTYQVSPVYGPSDLGKHLACFLLPVGAVVLLRTLRRRR